MKMEQSHKGKELIEGLLKFNTPTITNVVATYPQDKELCLGLYDPWICNWYTDQSLKCLYPELGPRAGYAVTVIYGPPSPGFDRLSLADVLRAIDMMPKPVIVCIKQEFPEGIKNKNGLRGGNMATAFKALGAAGIITDGPSRDVDEVRLLGIQYMVTGVCPGHGSLSVKAVNVPVNICGMDVCPGDIIHMDENGAVKFPADQLENVYKLACRLQKLEEKRMKMMSETRDAGKIINILNGFEDD